MSARQLISRLRSFRVSITASGERLQVTPGRGQLTEQMQQVVTSQKTDSLDLLTEGAVTSSTDLIPIPRGSVLPLSSFQQRLWVLHRLEPDNTAYNIVTVWPGPETSDAAQVERAIRGLVRNNEILRSVFRDHGVAPGVRFLEPDAVSVVVHDMRDRSEAEQAETIRLATSAATRTPFDLAVEAPARWAIYRLASDRLTILLAAHRIALDEWSLALLRRMLEAACAAEAGGPAAQPLAVQFVDYAAWQARIQNPSALATELDWWETKLTGIPQLCTFPTDRTTATVGSGSTCWFRWDAELVTGLRALLKRHGATIHMALLAVCAAVLRAHTGQDDIVLGSPMSTRDRPELEIMLGPFINLLVLRLDLSNDPTFAELLARARDAVLEAHDHRQVSFEALVGRLNPPRSPGRASLFQIAVVLHDASCESAAPIYRGSAVEDMTWYAREVDGRIEGSFEFRSDLYDHETTTRIARRIETAVRAMVRDPEREISRTSLLEEDERIRVLDRFNATAQELDPASFPVQFERQAVLQADRMAIRFEGEALTYDQLNRRANQLARYLCSRGLGSGALVGVCLERSLAMVVTLLAVQKAGAAYLPLDPGFPVERLSVMLADSGIVALVSSADISTRLEIPPDTQLIDPRAEANALDQINPSNLNTTILPADMAYVIYTSGSTGRPNGVAVPHCALSNFLGAMRRAPGLTASDVVAAVTTVSFDIAALEFYLPLTVGARVELVSRNTAADGMALAQLLSATEATVLQGTPTTWRLLIEAGWQARDGFRAFCGGETLSRDLADAVLENVQELWNLYGPTETTIWSTVERVEAGAAVVSIGRPIANTSVYVLDAAGQPTPIGISGEIWIGGDGLASGYHKRPDLTAARFVADPFSPRPGARMYRTGDLGRWGAGGRLFHMGRMDRQVKLRGFRIELGEIEAALLAHTAVSRAVVVARSPTSDHPGLVAYVVYHPAKELTASEARTHLRRTLPDYMIPSVFAALNSLPMTLNGKVDLLSLPDPFKNTSSSPTRFEAPAPGLEQLIAGIWQNLLQVHWIGANDNFFELGGHSLLSLRAVMAIEHQTGYRIQPRVLFFQSLRQVAAAVRREQAEKMHAR